MNDFMTLAVDLLSAVLLIAVPFFVKKLLDYAKRAIATYENDIGNSNLSIYMCEVADSVETAVAMVNQTYVDSIKASDKPFSREAQKLAFKRAYTLCLELLSDGAKDFLQKSFDNVEEIITAKIEAEVRRQKKDTVIDIPEVHVSEAVMVEKGPEPEPPSEDLVNG